MAENWGSCYFHPKSDAFLTVYVDDFIMSGPPEKLDEAWKRIQEVIDIDPP